MSSLSQNKTNFPSSEEALYFLEDVLERSHVPFFLLGDCANHIINNLDQNINDPIEVGIHRKDYTEFARSILPMFLPKDTIYTDKHIKFEHLGTPVTIKIIDRNYRVLKNLDVVFYKITNFKVPNPFSEYWRIKSIIR